MMGLRNAFRPAITLDEDFAETLDQAQEGQYAVVVTPPEDAPKDPREAAEEVYQAIHGELDSISFEIHQTRKGKIEFRTVTNSRDEAVVLRNRIIAEVKAAVEIEPATLDIAVGETVTGARLEYQKDHLLPLRSTQSHDVSDDPYSQVFETLAEEPESRAVIQFVVTPVVYARRFRWGYRLLQLWDERIEPTWTSRWSRWTIPAITTHRRRRKSSVAIASMLSLSMYAVWVFLGGNPFTALPSIQVLDWLVPSKLGPVTVPANFSTPLFGAGSPIDVSGQVSYVLMTLVVACLYVTAIFGDGLHWPRRRTSDTEGHRARGKGEKDDRQASRAERRTGEAIQAQGSDLGYRVNARVITIDEDALRASAYRASIVQQFENGWRNSATKQRLTSTTMGKVGHLHHRLPRFIERVAGRTPSRTRWFWIQKLLFQSERRKPIYMSTFEVAATGFWPVKSKGGTAAIEYTEATDTQDLLDDEGAGDEALEGDEPVILPDADEMLENGSPEQRSESSEPPEDEPRPSEDADETQPDSFHYND
jgi:hypothetical protein